MSEDQNWRVYIMPADPNQGVVRSGEFSHKPKIEEGEDSFLWLTGGPEEPVIVASMRTCLSVLVAKAEHIEQIEKAERTSAEDYESRP